MCDEDRFTSEQIHEKKREIAREKVEHYPAEVFQCLWEMFSTEIDEIKHERRELPLADLTNEELAYLALTGGGTALLELIERCLDGEGFNLEYKIADGIDDALAIEELEEQAEYDSEMEILHSASYRY